MKRVVLVAAAFLAAASAALAQHDARPEVIAAYPEWTRLNADRLAGNITATHPQSRDTFINLDEATLAALGDGPEMRFPDGTVIVQERVDATGTIVDRLYLMEKLDRVWLYGQLDREPDGTYALTDYGAARNQCSDCHQRAPTDYVFDR